MQALLNLLAGVSLLVWGTHNVRSGVLRIYGGDLRRILRHSVRNRFTALLAGLGVTGLILSPVFHRVMHQLHLPDDTEAEGDKPKPAKPKSKPKP